MSIFQHSLPDVASGAKRKLFGRRAHLVSSLHCQAEQNLVSQHSSSVLPCILPWRDRWLWAASPPRSAALGLLKRHGHPGMAPSTATVHLQLNTHPCGASPLDSLLGGPTEFGFSGSQRLPPNLKAFDSRSLLRSKGLEQLARLKLKDLSQAHRGAQTLIYPLLHNFNIELDARPIARRTPKLLSPTPAVGKSNTQLKM